MTESARLVKTGTANGTDIMVDVTALSNVTSKVTLSHDYVLVNPPPPGYPTIPGLTGVARASQEYPGLTIPSGTTIDMFPPEAVALIAAGAATAG